jgi:hypothetical protein
VFSEDRRGAQVALDHKDAAKMATKLDRLISKLEPFAKSPFPVRKKPEEEPEEAAS